MYSYKDEQQGAAQVKLEEDKEENLEGDKEDEEVAQSPKQKVRDQKAKKCKYYRNHLSNVQTWQCSGKRC